MITYTDGYLLGFPTTNVYESLTYTTACRHNYLYRGIFTETLDYYQFVDLITTRTPDY